MLSQYQLTGSDDPAEPISFGVDPYKIRLSIVSTEKVGPSLLRSRYRGNGGPQQVVSIYCCPITVEVPLGAETRWLWAILTLKRAEIVE